MEVFIIVFLISLGIVCIILEVIFFPGTTIVGIAGIIAIIFGIYRSYDLYGHEVGVWVAIISSVFVVIALIYSFRKNAWSMFSLKQTNKHKVNEGLTSRLCIGQEGMTATILKPIGNATFEGERYEVKSFGEMIDEQVRIKIVSIDKNCIIVEKLN